ncbi:hypothetical protein J2S43_002353 [Catenuloplanes nepalensis]|uniref:Uncharacterized protein n=1 Tax=Catenuloplanes nepalensis TaxID=587533 RepID=A0ABT9MQX7_9ACTN|nr:hypothetical protein [Catenuloplanes nepalensis]MDP9793841.1 hypothetical protein [Catenuloplanes nepalensis]
MRIGRYPLRSLPATATQLHDEYADSWRITPAAGTRERIERYETGRMTLRESRRKRPCHRFDGALLFPICHVLLR